MTSPARSSSRADSYFVRMSSPGRTTPLRRSLSRCDIFQLDATQEEVFDLMRSIARAGYETLTPDDCQVVVDFIEQNGDDRAISLRLLEPSFRKVIYARTEGLDWRPLVMTQLKTLGRREDTSRRIDAKAQESGCSTRPSNGSHILWGAADVLDEGDRQVQGLVLPSPLTSPPPLISLTDTHERAVQDRTLSTESVMNNLNWEQSTSGS